MSKKIYVWAEFEADYFDGLAFAIAKSEGSAKEMILNKYSNSLRRGIDEINWGLVQVFDLNSDIAFMVVGGQ